MQDNKLTDAEEAMIEVLGEYPDLGFGIHKELLGPEIVSKLRDKGYWVVEEYHGWDRESI